MKRTPSMQTFKRQGAFTFIELIVAALISSLVALAIMSLFLMSLKMDRSIFSQQRSLHDAKSAIETLNREIRLAQAPLTVLDAAGNAADDGNRVEFGRTGEAPDARAIELVSDDGDLTTPWDNRLIYDPDTTAAGDEQLICDMVSPTNATLTAFNYQNATTPLQVTLRTGDPVRAADTSASDAYTGRGMQGVEINITVAPRN